MSKSKTPNTAPTSRLRSMLKKLLIWIKGFMLKIRNLSLLALIEIMMELLVMLSHTKYMPDQLSEILQKLSYLSGRFDSEIPTIKQDIKDLKNSMGEFFTDHETRLKKIENAESVKRGQNMIIALIVSTVVTALINWFFRSKL